MEAVETAVGWEAEMEEAMVVEKEEAEMAEVVMEAVVMVEAETVGGATEVEATVEEEMEVVATVVAVKVAEEKVAGAAGAVEKGICPLRTHRSLRCEEFAQDQVKRVSGNYL